MHSTTQSATECSFKPLESCNGRQLRSYFKNTPQELNICRQCRTKYGVIFSADAAADGADVENMFRDIMAKLATAKRT